MQNPPPPPPSGGYPPPPPPPEMQPTGPPPMPYPAQPPVAYAPAVSYGGFWIRVVAYIIDAILLGIVGGILLVVFRADLSNPSNAGYNAARLFDLVVSAAYFTAFWTLWGASPGQRILGLRIVDANTGQPIASVGKAFVRWLGLFISFLVCFIGVIWVAFDPRKQGWMDKIAGTVVVRA